MLCSASITHGFSMENPCSSWRTHGEFIWPKIHGKLMDFSREIFMGYFCKGKPVSSKTARHHAVNDLIARVPSLLLGSPSPRSQLGQTRRQAPRRIYADPLARRKTSLLERDSCQSGLRRCCRSCCLGEGSQVLRRITATLFKSF